MGAQESVPSWSKGGLSSRTKAKVKLNERVHPYPIPTADEKDEKMVEQVSAASVEVEESCGAMLRMLSRRKHDEDSLDVVRVYARELGDTGGGALKWLKKQCREKYLGERLSHVAVVIDIDDGCEQLFMERVTEGVNWFKDTPVAMDAFLRGRGFLTAAQKYLPVDEYHIHYRDLTMPDVVAFVREQSGQPYALKTNNCFHFVHFFCGQFVGADYLDDIDSWQKLVINVSQKFYQCKQPARERILSKSYRGERGFM